MGRPNNCPICTSSLKPNKWESKGRDAQFFSCPQCGDFLLLGPLLEMLPKIINEKDDALKISHALITMQQANKVPKLSYDTIEKILERPLPSLVEQADIFIRWLARNIEAPGETVQVCPHTHSAVMGAKTPEGFDLVLKHLLKVDLINIDCALDSTLDTVNITLSFDGWAHYERLLIGGATYRKAFMAMKFGDEELDSVVKSVFTPCVDQAGFELFRLDDKPTAGLIDDRLRVEIQAADFLIADLTHDNLGAYWEAGYAEGLGKPVIYTCEKEKFEKDKTHFDTNHHLTIVWDKNSPKEAGEDLKATIRATLPQLAKQLDE